MNPHSQELATLKELLSIFTDTQSTMRRYKRNQITAGIISLGLILLALLGGSIGILQTQAAVIAALFGGMTAGISYLYRCSVIQAPFMTQYTSLNVASVRDRIREIEEIQSK